MKPRRPIFALDYIEPTTRIYSELASSQAAQSQPELQLLLRWSHDVLREYFSVVDTHPRIDACRELFQAANALSDRCRVSREGNEHFGPFLRDPDRLPGLSIETLQQLATYRRSCRWYLERPVPREIIDKAIDVARLSPSACNRQPFRYVIFDDSATASEIGALSMGTVGFSQNFSAITVLVGRLDAFPFDRDRHVIYIDAALSAMAFQFALEVQGVSSCCINWPDIAAREKAMANRLGLQEYERPIMSISFGYADLSQAVPYSEKKSLDEMRVFAK